jgi:hypothetical protein
MNGFPSAGTLWQALNIKHCANDVTKWLQIVLEGFTRAAHRVTVFSRTAILAPGGWASDREPAKRFCGRSACARD